MAVSMPIVSEMTNETLVDAADPSPEQREELAQRAEKLREELPDDLTPVVVEFAGSPKSGKSTTIEIVSHFFHRTKFRVLAPSEGASKRSPYHLRRDLVAFNAWTLNYAISELLVGYFAVERPHLIFLDRGPFDSIAWMGLLKKRGELKDDEYAIMRDFALHPQWSNLVSRLYLFTCAPSVSLERENTSKLVRREGTAMNPDTLNELLAEYEDVKNNLSTYPVHAVDTSSDTTPLSTSFEVTEDILSIFARKCKR
jgi:hypothetical protein